MKVQNFKENKHPTAIKKNKYLKNHFDEINVWDVTIRNAFKLSLLIGPLNPLVHPLVHSEHFKPIRRKHFEKRF